MTDTTHNICRQSKAQSQDGLWDWAGDRQIVPAACRNYAGDFAEELTATVTGARRLATNSKYDLCPDLEWDDRTFIEAKSVGVSAQAIVYKWRLEKDQTAVLQHGHRLFYFLWHHHCNATNIRYLFDLRRQMAANMEYGVVVSMGTLAKILNGRKVKTLNKKHAKDTQGKERGYGKRGYGDGWCVPLTKLLECCDTRIEWPLPVWTRVYNLPVHSKVYFEPSALRLLGDRR